MGVLRKSESRVQRAFSGLFGRAFKSHVQPVELAQKLVKEMEANKVPLLSRTYVPNRFTVYPCPGDREHLDAYEDSLVEELESHLLGHARRERLDMAGPPTVQILTDDDLKLGFFGIKAEPVRPEHEEAQGRGVAPVIAPLAAPDARATRASAAGRRVGSDTESISADEAAGLRLARRTLILGYGGAAREFNQSRVVLGRGRDADLQVSDPNVSRMHAVIYWEGDRVYVKDLGSTNGTFVNNRPVTSGPVSDGDVIGVGNVKISLRVR